MTVPSKEADPTYKLVIEGNGTVQKSNLDLEQFKLSRSIDLIYGDGMSAGLNAYLHQNPDQLNEKEATDLRHMLFAKMNSRLELDPNDKFGQLGKQQVLEEMNNAIQNQIEIGNPTDEFLDTIIENSYASGAYPLDIQSTSTVKSVQENNTSIQNVLVESLNNKKNTLDMWLSAIRLVIPTRIDPVSRNQSYPFVKTAVIDIDQMENVREQLQNKNSIGSTKVITFADPYLESLKTNVENMIGKEIMYPKINRSTDCSVLALQFANMGVLWDIVYADSNDENDYHSSNLKEIVFTFCIPKFYNAKKYVETFINKNLKAFATQLRMYVPAEHYTAKEASIKNNYFNKSMDEEYISHLRSVHQTAVKDNRNDILMFKLTGSFATEYVTFLNIMYNNIRHIYNMYRKVIEHAPAVAAKMGQPLMDVRAKEAKFIHGYKKTKYSDKILAVYAKRIPRPIDRQQGFRAFEVEPPAGIVDTITASKVRATHENDNNCIQNNFNCKIGPKQYFKGPLVQFSFYADTEEAKEIVDSNLELDCSRIRDNVNIMEVASHVGIRVQDTGDIEEVCNLINKTVKEKRKALRLGL